MALREPSRRLASFAGFLLASAAAWSEAEVTFSARVDGRKDVYIDVKNAGPTGIRVMAMIVGFYDQKQSLIEKNTTKCREDCFVGGRETKSFGPVKGPKGFDTVKAIDVAYKENDAIPVEPGDRPPPKPTPSSQSAASTGVSR